jgi:L-rhamnose mutarotase
MKRVIHQARLKPETLDEYLQHHRNVPAEVEQAYRRAGIQKVSCFVNGCDLLVLTEYDQTQYPASRPQLEADPAEIAWQQAMAPLKDDSVESREFTEIYRME